MSLAPCLAVPSVARAKTWDFGTAADYADVASFTEVLS